jgi:GTP-binding protein HflX
MNKDALFSDTVGFIRDLPPDLMPAFKATLEELHEADLLLHVVDIGDSRKDQQIGSVLKVLEEMKLLDRPRILVFNKIDLLEPEIAQNICNLYQAFGVQALDLKTLKPLLSFIEQRLTELNAFQKYNRKYIDFSEYEHLYQKYQNQEDPDQE